MIYNFVVTIGLWRSVDAKFSAGSTGVVHGECEPSNTGNVNAKSLVIRGGDTVDLEALLRLRESSSYVWTPESAFGRT